MATYTTLTEVESQTREGVMYRIQRNDETGHLTCSCPSFKFQRLEVDARSCKHTRMIEEIGVATFLEKLKVKRREMHQEWATEEDLIVWATPSRSLGDIVAEAVVVNPLHVSKGLRFKIV